MAYTTIDDASLYFRVKIYNGSSSDGNAITWDETHANMQPDWLWLKNRTSAQEHWLADVIRGTGKFLESNSANAESSDGATGLASFDTNGFTLNDSARTNRNTMVGWGWKANGSSTVTNSSGNVSATVSVNDTAGFSIMSYTGNGSNAQSIGHSLSAKPKVYLIKGRSYSVDWQMFVEELGAGGRLQLSTDEAFDTSSTVFGNTVPTSSLLYVGANSATDSPTNRQNETYICYAFRPIKGYSAMGTWLGNGSSEGPFIYTGFSPSFVLGKNTSRSDNWFMLDNKRDAFNPVDQRLQPDTTGTESTVTTLGIDFCSNGFKLRGATNQYNASGETTFYMAFAKAPLVNSNGVPTNAE